MSEPVAEVDKPDVSCTCSGEEERDRVDMDRIDYPKIIQDALRDVVRRVLAQAAEQGIPGEHHFLIAFRTEHPGVVVPKFLRDMYPEEIKIILQHQYWDLEVDQEAFSVSLSFNAQRQRLIVPFAAVNAFVDPSVELVLRFESPGGAPGEVNEEEQADVVEEPVPEVSRPVAEVLRFDPSRRK
jgi:hypothetical protein